MMDNRQKFTLVLIVLLAIAIGCVGTMLLIELSGIARTRITPTPPVITTSAPADSDPVWDRIQKNGMITVGISADYAPFAYIGPDFSLQGFEIALNQELSKRLGIPVNLKNMAFDGLANALQLGQIDMAVAAISVTPERSAVIDFSNIYFVSQDAVLAAPNSTITISGPADLASLRVGAQRGTVYASWLQSTLVVPGLMPAQNAVEFSSADEMIAALNGANPVIQVALLDLLPAQEAQAQGRGRLAGSGINPQMYAIAIPKGATTLQAKLNDALAAMVSDGTMAALQRTFLNISQPVPPPTPTPTPVIPLTPTPVPTARPPACLDGMAFVADLNYPDNGMQNPASFPPGTVIQKGWRIRNTGTCSWNSSYVLAYTGSVPPNSPVGGSPVAIQGVVAPGATYDIYATLTAPSTPGTYQSFWSLRNGNGMFFGDRLWVGLRVTSGPATPTPGPAAPVIYSFSADPTQVIAGQCVTLRWSFGGQNLALARLFRGQQVILQDMALNGSSWDCPTQPGMTEYRLVVDSEFSGSTSSSKFVNVTPASQPTPTSPPVPPPLPPVINSFQSDKSQVNLGECLRLEWSFSAVDLASAQVLRNGEVIVPNPSLQGRQKDCPPAAGQVEYRLVVTGATSGTAQQSVYVSVVNVPPTDSPPVILDFSVSPGEIAIGQCFNLSWSFTGSSLASSNITRNGLPILTDVMTNGYYQDCINDPNLVGQLTYELNVASEFSGSTTQSETVNVLQLLK
jgi:ABC-type amino acid transport substrate-binding protein